ncbi:MAG TPA: DivIVA domain-containing protein [Fimbriimonadaceae bacterium]|nr:DivIVA domain-containing protein [Fimbriimonadaceae bacterium]
MERIRPVDLERVSLPTAMRGYKREAVDDLVRACSAEIEALLGEIKVLNEHIERQKSQIEAFHAKEETLTKALMLAQKAADDTRASAHKEAELIVRDARRKADDMEREMAHQLGASRSELEGLRQEKQRFLAQFRGMLESQLRALDDKPSLSVLPGYAGESIAVSS